MNSKLLNPRDILLIAIVSLVVYLGAKPLFSVIDRSTNATPIAQ